MSVAAVVAMLISCMATSPVMAQEDELALSAPSACLMEQSSGKVLYEKNSHDIRACASITKVMTLILTFEAIENGTLHYDDMLSASAHASSMGGSDIWLKEGEQMSVNDLIKATVVMSANDAAVVLAEAVAGSEEAFVVRMNEKAAQLGMNDTVFKNCNGLDQEGHVTSAYDVALMSRELMNYKKIFDYTNIWIDYIRDGATQLVNTNKLLKSYKGITGLKTGTTSQAGSCVSATAERSGMSIIAVILGDDTTENRFKDATALLNYGFANYTIVTPEFTVPESVTVKGGMKGSVATEFEGGTSVLTAVKDKGGVEVKVEIKDEITAPIAKGDIVGSVIFTASGEKVKEIPIKAAGNVEKISFSSAFKKIMVLFFS